MCTQRLNATMRDSRILYWYNFLFGVTLGLALWLGPAQGLAWLVMPALIAVHGLSVFVDNNNQHWTLHPIDWITFTNANRGG